MNTARKNPVLDKFRIQIDRANSRTDVREIKQDIDALIEAFRGYTKELRTELIEKMLQEIYQVREELIERATEINCRQLFEEEPQELSQKLT